MTTVELLTAARARVAAGWFQGHYFSEGSGKCCAAGALSPSSPRNGVYAAEHSEAHALLRRAIKPDDPGWNDLTHWNDHPKRTQVEVLAAYDAAIALAQAQETV